MNDPDEPPNIPPHPIMGGCVDVGVADVEVGVGTGAGGPVMV